MVNMVIFVCIYNNCSEVKLIGVYKTVDDTQEAIYRFKKENGLDKEIIVNNPEQFVGLQELNDNDGGGNDSDDLKYGGSVTEDYMGTSYFGDEKKEVTIYKYYL